MEVDTKLGGKYNLYEKLKFHGLVKIIFYISIGIG